MVILAYLAAAAALQSPGPSKSLSAAEAGQLAVASMRKQDETRRRIRGWPDEQLQAELNKSVSGKTKLIFQAGHGVYAEYTAPDGTLRMWYPRNVNVVKGSWGCARCAARPAPASPIATRSTR